MPPPQLAAELAAAIRMPEGALVGSAAAAGPFLNFSMHTAAAWPPRCCRRSSARGERYGSRRPWAPAARW